MSFDGFICRGVGEEVNVFSFAESYPIGTRIRLADDYPGAVHEVCGYEWYDDRMYILFKDGTKLSHSRLDLILEVA